MFHANYLRRLHPFYYRRGMVYALLFCYVSTVILLGLQQGTYNQSGVYKYLREFSPVSQVWGVAYGIAGIGLLWSLNFGRQIYIQVCAGTLAVITSMWGIAFLLAFILTGMSPYAWTIYAFLAFWGWDLLTDPLVIGPRKPV